MLPQVAGRWKSGAPDRQLGVERKQKGLFCYTSEEDYTAFILFFFPFFFLSFFVKFTLGKIAKFISSPEFDLWADGVVA